jgi:hypothetical protein
VLVFSQAGCAACDALLPDVARWQYELDGRVTVAVVSGGSADRGQAMARQHGLRRVLADERRSVLSMQLPLGQYLLGQVRVVDR